MTRGRFGTLYLSSCGSFIRYSPPALTDAFSAPIVLPMSQHLFADRASPLTERRYCNLTIERLQAKPALGPDHRAVTCPFIFLPTFLC